MEKELRRTMCANMARSQTRGAIRSAVAIASQKPRKSLDIGWSSEYNLMCNISHYLSRIHLSLSSCSAGIDMDEKVALPSLARENLAEEAYQVLRDRIFSHQFACGERLDLASIESQLGISRTPLKAALDRLATEGLVEIVPRRGTYVTTPTPEAIEQAFSVREVLEGYAVTCSVESMTGAQLERLEEIVKAMLRITQVNDHAPIYNRYAELDHSFHSLIVKAAGNDVLTKLWGQVHAHVQIARIRYRRGDRKLDLTTREHKGIFAALQARDVNAAEALMRDHIHRAKVSLQEDLQSLDSP